MSYGGIGATSWNRSRARKPTSNDAVHVCVLGAGGLGSAIGGWLARSGVDVTLVARPAHVEAIAADGLRITGIRGEAVIRERLRAVTDAAAVDGDVDYLILGVKTRDTDAALTGAASLRDRTKAACSLQNSVTKDERLRQWTPGATIGASTTESATLVEPGVVRHNATAPIAFYFGELDGKPAERVEVLVDLFGRAGFGAAVTTEIAHVEWEKLLQIALMAAFSVSTLGFLPNAFLPDGWRVRAGAEHYVALAIELLAVYRALGYEPADFFAPYARFRTLAASTPDEAVADIQALGEQMAVAGMKGRPSLHDDLLRGRPTEVDESVAVFVAAADRLGVPVPTVRAALRVIRTLEALVTAPV